MTRPVSFVEELRDGLMGMAAEIHRARRGASNIDQIAYWHDRIERAVNAQAEREVQT